jgi:hypothetical protein
MRALIITASIICFSGMSVLWAQWDTYPTYDEYISIMSKFGVDYPSVCRIEEFGESVQGRKLLAAKISDNVNEEEMEPSFLFLSTIHGNEVVGYVLMLHLIDYLLSQYGKDTLVTKLVNSIEIWVNPLANPDGTYKMGNDKIDGAVRYNANNIDLNRNFPRVPPSGNTPDPEKETTAIIDFVRKYNFVMSADLHCGEEGAQYPWAYLGTATTDHDWFVMVTKEYADIVRAIAPIGYFNYLSCGYGCITPPTAYGKPHIADYLLYYEHCRDICLQLSMTKFPAENQLSEYWDFNYQSMLNYIEQVLFGIRGTVTDTLTGEPLNAKVFIENHDKDSSHVYSHLPYGDYYRPVYEGTYNVTFSCDGYYPKTKTGLQVNYNEATVLNVKLRKMTSKIIPEINITVKGIKTIEIYDLMGRKIKTLPANAFTNWKKDNGIYIVRFGGDFKKQYKIMVTK